MRGGSRAVVPAPAWRTSPGALACPRGMSCRGRRRGRAMARLARARRLEGAEAPCRTTRGRVRHRRRWATLVSDIATLAAIAPASPGALSSSSAKHANAAAGHRRQVIEADLGGLAPLHTGERRLRGRYAVERVTRFGVDCLSCGDVHRQTSSRPVTSDVPPRRRRRNPHVASANTDDGGPACRGRCR